MMTKSDVRVKTPTACFRRMPPPAVINKEIMELLRKHASNRDEKRDSPASDRTQELRKQTLVTMFKDLYRLGYKLTSVKNIKQKHLHALAKSWTTKNLSPATITSYLTSMRLFLTWIGKRDMMLPKDVLFMDINAVKRTSVAIEDKSWSSRGLRAHEVFNRVAKIDPRVACQLELALAFGLRRRETIMLRPYDADHGTALLLAENMGTKGGRARVIPIETVEQRRVLNQAKAMVISSAGHMGDPQKSLKQNLDHFRNTLSSAGVTQRELGATAHGLRSQFLNDLFEKRAGIPSPIRQSSVSRVMSNNSMIDAPEMRHAAIMETTAAAGHCRASVMVAYGGSFIRPLVPALETKRVRLKNLQRRTDRSPEDDEEIGRLFHELGLYP